MGVLDIPARRLKAAEAASLWGIATEGSAPVKKPALGCMRLSSARFLPLFVYIQPANRLPAEAGRKAHRKTNDRNLDYIRAQICVLEAIGPPGLACKRLRAKAAFRRPAFALSACQNSKNPEGDRSDVRSEAECSSGFCGSEWIFSKVLRGFAVSRDKTTLLLSLEWGKIRKSTRN